MDFINGVTDQAPAAVPAVDPGKAPAVPVPEPAKPAAEPAKEPAAPAAFDMQAWLDRHVPTDPKGIAKVEDWKAQRGLLQKALADLNEVGLENAMLKQAGVKPAAAAADPNTPVLPETEAVKALQIENQALQQRYEADLQEWQAHKARNELEGIDAFRAEFDGRRAGLVAEMEAVAHDAGIDKAIVKALVDAGTEYKISKALEDLDDPTAKSLLTGKAREFVKLTQAKDAARQNPLEEVAKWRDYQESMRGVVATTVAKDLQGAYLNAVGEVATVLTGKEGDIFFQTPGGRQTLEGLSQRLSRGVDITPKEVIEALAWKEAGQVYRSLGVKQAQQIAALKQELARYGAADPARLAGEADPTGGAGKGTGFDPARMFG